MAETTSTEAAKGGAIGRIVRIVGAVVDVEFPADAMPAIYNALTEAGVTADMSAGDICDKMVAQFTAMTFDGLTGEGMTWDASGAVTKSPKGMVIQDGAYVGMD